VHAAALERQNSGLRERLAAMDSVDRTIRVAQTRGMVMPPPGEYRYLRAHPWLDAAVAARRPKPASPTIVPAPPATQGPATQGTSTPTSQGTATTTASAAGTPATTAGTP